MIVSVSGAVAAVTADAVVVQVGGVGLALLATPGTRARLRVGDDVTLATSLVVREDSLTLYGFSDDDERRMFELLQGATGVGPKLAQAVLTVHPPEAVRRALQTEDLVALTMVPGIGRKGAQRLVLELKDRVSAVPVAGATPGAGWRDLLTGALTGLGWTAAQADEVVVRLAGSHPAAVDADVPALLREALTLMGRAR